VANTSIEWAKNADGSDGKSWNPIRARNIKTGKVGWYCQKCSPGCLHCYSERMNLRVSADGLHGIGNGIPFAADKFDQVELFLDEEVLLAPLKWKKPTKVFVESTSDLFGVWVGEDWLDRIYAVEALCPQHTFIHLTKRPGRRKRYLKSLCLRQEFVGIEAEYISGLCRYVGTAPRWPFPLRNVWEGITVVNQAEYNNLGLLETPFWLSIEPMQGPICLHLNMNKDSAGRIGCEDCGAIDVPVIALPFWVVCGGETGPGARIIHPEWVRTLRDQCAATKVPFFFKQWGEWKAESVDGTEVELSKLAPNQCVTFGDGETNHTLHTRVGKVAAGRLLDGVEHNEFPEVAR